MDGSYKRGKKNMSVFILLFWSFLKSAMTQPKDVPILSWFKFTDTPVFLLTAVVTLSLACASEPEKSTESCRQNYQLSWLFLNHT